MPRVSVALKKSEMLIGYSADEVLHHRLSGRDQCKIRNQTNLLCDRLLRARVDSFLVCWRQELRVGLAT